MLLLRSFYSLPDEVEPVQRGIYDVIGQVMARHGLTDTRPTFSAAEFDVCYSDLLATCRTYGSEVYDAVKQLPAFVRLTGNPKHEQVMRELRPGSVPGIAAGGSGIRIDNPGEDRFRAQWHQEYPAQLRSIDGLVFWSPLVVITAAMGPVQICFGSHRDGPRPVFTASPGGDPARKGAYALTLKDEATILSSYKRVEPLTRPGDLLIMDFLTLHASGHNRASRSRWSMQFRYFNFADPTGRAHGWRGSFAAGDDFRAIHPDLCADTEAQE
jgi:hypothetical protein